jgi:hypothetical protein
MLSVSEVPDSSAKRNSGARDARSAGEDTTEGYLFVRSDKGLLAGAQPVNVGVLAESSILCSVGVVVGVGLGQFGVLSIIRLRSTEIARHDDYLATTPTQSPSRARVIATYSSRRSISTRSPAS